MASESNIHGSRFVLFNQSSQFIIKDTTINVIGGDQYTHSNAIVGNTKGTEWITAPDPLENFRIAYPKIVENTGTWLLEDKSFQNWKTNGSLLWLQGKAGTGKTFLCTNIIDNFRKGANPVVFYYFDTRDQAKVNYDGFVSSILCQVAGRANNEHAKAKLLTLYNSSQEGNFLVAEAKRAILSDLIKTIDTTVYIVIDGVDECEEQKKVMDLVGDLSKLNNCFVLLASRPHLSMATSSIATGQRIMISLDDKSGVNADIERYVDVKVEESGFSEELKAEIKTALVNSGNGQIRWVDCQWTVIKEIVMPDDIREALQSLPSTLEETYAKLLEQSKSKAHVKKLLQWLIYAFRALRIEEVEDILAVNLNKETYSIGNKLPNLETQLHKLISSTLVVVTKIEKGSWNTSTEVQLAHPSVKEYLLSEAVIQSASGYFQMNSALAHEVIGQTCIVYLLCCGKVVIDVEKFALASYAAQYWFLHFNQTEESQAILNLSIRLLNITEPTYQHWLTLYTPDTLNKKPDPEYIPQPLYYASFLGLKNVVLYMLEHNDVKNTLGYLEIVRALIENGDDVSAQGEYYGNALQAASYAGHLEVVKVLLEKRADFNVHSGYYGNALQAASHGGQLDLVKVLLENRADANAQGGSYGNAIQAASDRGHLEVVKVLLENRADVNAQGGLYGNALQAASLGGHLEVIKVLLERRAAVNAQGGVYGNSLQAASYGGHLEVVKVLLDNSADVNAQGGYYGNALQAASNGGHLEVVKILLESKADTNAQGGYYGSALQAASNGGYLEVVKVLFESKADVNEQRKYYGNVLQAASTFGHLWTVSALLENGHDVNAQGGYYGNPLQAASTFGHLEIVRTCLAYRADVNAEGGYYGNALQAASNGGHLEVILELLENGGDVNAQGGHYGNALQAASAIGHLEIVRICLAYGADVNAQGGYYGNALQAASNGGYLEVVLELLQTGGDVNAQGGYYGNALQAASNGGHWEVILELLETGGDVNAQGGHYGNALQAASIFGRLEIVRTYLAYGADVNVEGGYYGNALQAASNRGHLEVILELLENGGDVNAQGGHYGNALQAASYAGHLEVVKALLEHQADVNAQGGYHGNTLQAANLGGHLEVVKVLLENGADDVDDESMEIYYSCDEF
ncbi:hypothetical protein D9758_018989 [Tetrapyrgos nigripes]|uniref:NACHT domain-containing protein n=1 Tax=Tetrapyrgos nigripes TaxID=182062 RepID=A0A8H5BRC3_9AGAR|nr:hypothetical protein D9758_018989 [Tetrapyrgos nigripes]